MARIGKAAGIIPAAKSERNHMAWYGRRQQAKKQTAAKPGAFQAALRKASRGT